MKISDATRGVYYQSLANLFYAIAACDNYVHEEEVLVMKQILKGKWLAIDDSEDEFGSDAATRIEIVFDWLLKKDANAEECFTAFETYKSAHEDQFGETVNNLILNTAYSIANAFEGINKEEKEMLVKLYKLFGNK